MIHHRRISKGFAWARIAIFDVVTGIRRLDVMVSARMSAGTVRNNVLNPFWCLSLLHWGTPSYRGLYGPSVTVHISEIEGYVPLSK